jgi:hypothetical protein
MQVTQNNKGDTVGIIKDAEETVILNYSFWECDCSTMFIRPVTITHCRQCGADRDDSPIANDLHVQIFVYNTI